MLNIPNIHIAKEMPAYGFSSPAFNFKPMDNETRRILDEFFEHYNDGVLEVIEKCHVIGNKESLFKRVKTNIEVSSFSEKKQSTFYEIILDNKNINFTFETINTIVNKQSIEIENVKKLIISSILLGSYGYACRLIELYHSQLDSDFHTAKRHIKNIDAELGSNLCHEAIAKIIPQSLHSPQAKSPLTKWALRYFFKEVYLKRYHHAPNEVQCDLQAFIDRDCKSV